jgi:hypothetical protein
MADTEDTGFSMKQRNTPKPPLCIIYGSSGIGKTGLAAQSENNVFIQTEDGAGELQLTTLKDGVFTNYDDIMNALRYVYKNPQGIKHLVLDSLDHLEPIVWDYVCKKAEPPWPTIETPGFARGYVEADLAWKRIINAMLALRDDKNIAIIVIAHDVIRTAKDPMVGPYDAHDLKLHKRAVGLWKEHADLIGLMKSQVVVDSKTNKGKGGTSPSLFVRPNAAYVAKTRYTTMPSMIPIDIETGWADIIQYIPYYNQNKG